MPRHLEIWYVKYLEKFKLGMIYDGLNVRGH